MQVAQDFQNSFYYISVSLSPPPSIPPSVYVYNFYDTDLSPCTVWKLNLGCQARQQAPLPLSHLNSRTLYFRKLPAYPEQMVVFQSARNMPKLGPGKA